uniref:DMT family transporter n=1 Tax=Roseihalotalea indica TaxID=2867963 RepID=A0AA49GLT5_9BACT|nr:DMT family transporter [Tunicatimonas sp. TK19036]
MAARTKHYLLLHFIVLIWGFTAVLGLLITIPSVEIVFFRTLIAFITLAGVVWYRKVRFKLPANATLSILGTGVLIALHWILFFGAARVSTASVTLAGMATCSLWTSLVEPFMTHRKVQVYEVLLGLVVIVGLYVIFRFEFTHALGLGMAIFSAFLAAVFTVNNARYSKSYDPYLVTFYEMLGACVSIAIFFPMYQKWISSDGVLYLNPSIMDWFWLMVLALACTVYAYSMSVELMKYVTAFAMNLTNNLEPVYGIILAILVFGEKEQMTPGFYMGTAIILVSVFAYPLIRRYRKVRRFQRINSFRKFKEASQ